MLYLKKYRYQFLKGPLILACTLMCILESSGFENESFACKIINHDVYFKKVSLQHCVLQGPLQIGSPFSQLAVQALLPEGSLGPGSQNLHWSRFPPLEPPPKDPKPEPKEPNDPNPDPNPPNRFDAVSPQNPQRSQRCLQDPPVNKAKRGLGLSLGQSSQMEQSSIVNSSDLKLCNQFR